MRFSELWLREWVNSAIDSDVLANQITMVGLEIDGVEPVAGSFHGVVVGEVVEYVQHLNADKLCVTKVNVDGDRLLDIACGAPNYRQDLRVAVATIDAVLSGDSRTRAVKLRGEPSEGMLCSLSEPGTPDDHNGIIELPVDTPIGTDIREYLELDDNTIEISVTLNRADRLSIIGVARDVTVLNQLPLVEPKIVPAGAAIDDTLPTAVGAPDACSRYPGRVVKDINAKVLTPLWMKEKLRRRGVRSIDAVVDVINYVLLRLGQPMHAFDKDRTEGGIVVWMAKEGETLVLFDGTEIKLNADILVITGRNKALAMGGIFGGEHFGVNDEAQNALLECALFSPLSITGCARRHDLHTDVSHRYERGVDPALQHKAMERATRLLIDICGDEVGLVTGITNEAMLPKRATITSRRSRLDRLIGHHIAGEQVTDILRRFGCEVTEGKDEWQVIAPSWRFDVEIEEDPIEEVARVYGYNNILDEPVQASLIMGTHREADLPLKRVKTPLNDKGYQEVITYSFVDPEVQQMIHLSVGTLLLSSPIFVEMSAIRLSSWTGLLATVVYSQNRQQNRVRAFESGPRFVPDTQVSLGTRQDLMSAGVIYGNRYEEHWNLVKEIVNPYGLKGDLEPVLDLTGKLDEAKSRAEANSVLHPGQPVAIYLKGERAGPVGVVHPELERKLDLNGRTLVFELEWNKFADRVVPQTCEIPRFPANRRDITVVVAENVPTADILSECKRVGVNQVVGVNLFDMYRGKGVAEGYKSLAINLTLQDTSHTLEEEEIAATVAKCVEALKERFQASLRD